MIHDFATTPRQTDWRARSQGVEFKSDTRNKTATQRQKTKPILVVLLIGCIVLLVLQKLVLTPEPVLDQQPDQDAKREYAQSLMYSENISIEQASFETQPEPVAPVEFSLTTTKTLAPVPVKKKKPELVEEVHEEPLQMDPDYEFYDSLRQDDWPVPVAKGTYVDKELANRVKPIYKLQAASFRNSADAYRLVAKLKKRKLRALVAESVSTSGEFWYQVSVGPFVNTSKLNKAQDILVSLGMMPLKKRVN